MLEVVMYTTGTCPYCHAARQLLKRKGVQYTEIDVQTVERRVEMVNRSGRRTVPQIFFGNWHVGGYDDLAQLDVDGELMDRLNPRLAG